ncbi:MAG: sigma-70 family RNA polymerase sigma factor [Prevotella sp.]|nr:sigma-70 family RNA polymerase sigma factor [Prevotella sp.]
MSDKEIIDGLINGDDIISRQFFMENCRPLFMTIINKVFSYHVDYDEFVNEFYIYLMENDAARLRQFEGRSCLYQWLKTVALRFALLLRKRSVVIDMNTDLPLYTKDNIPSDDSWKHSKIDIDNLLGRMHNERHVYVIRRHLIDGIDEPTLAAELGIKVSNLYNIKKRAITALTQVALTDIKQYGKPSK